jgi:hypothetical protein
VAFRTCRAAGLALFDAGIKFHWSECKKYTVSEMDSGGTCAESPKSQVVLGRGYRIIEAGRPDRD